MSRDAIRELAELLEASGAQVRIGLRAQGHIPKIQRMLACRYSWTEIGKAIGWCPDTAKKWYGYELRSAHPPPTPEEP